MFCRLNSIYIFSPQENRRERFLRIHGNIRSPGIACLTCGFVLTVENMAKFSETNQIVTVPILTATCFHQMSQNFVRGLGVLESWFSWLFAFPNIYTFTVYLLLYFCNI